MSSPILPSNPSQAQTRIFEDILIASSSFSPTKGRMRYISLFIFPSIADLAMPIFFILIIIIHGVMNISSSPLITKPVFATMFSGMISFRTYFLTNKSGSLTPAKARIYVVPEKRGLISKG